MTLNPLDPVKFFNLRKHPQAMPIYSNNAASRAESSGAQPNLHQIVGIGA